MNKDTPIAMPPDIAEENARRLAKINAPYHPLTGDSNDPARVPYEFNGTRYHLPRSMTESRQLAKVAGQRDFNMLRFKYDFEYWAAACVRITDKITGADVPFILNRPQRRLARVLERMREAEEPLRVIMLKARQWGGSTLVQIYFAWIQIVHRTNWNSLICAHVKDTAATIRGMYSKLLSRYPEEYWEEECKAEFKPFERMTNTRVIPGRECKVTICSSENQEATRGMDCAMAHLSEVAFWKDSTQHDPADLLRSVVSGIARKPLSAIVMESTANGVGNFFHREWMRAGRPGESDKTRFFVPWHEIDIYSEKVADPAKLWEELDNYERSLWTEQGCTLEAVRWYHERRKEFPDHCSMMAEFPSTPDEAFATTSHNVFGHDEVERLRRDCYPAPLRGDMTGGPSHRNPHAEEAACFTQSNSGDMQVWHKPRRGGEYMVTVDIGGRTTWSDFSVIAVIDLHTDSRAAGADSRPEVVAQWRGHTDHDVLGWKAAGIARYYNMALLVVESNMWESNSEGHRTFILQSLHRHYPNIYRRGSGLPGFHTNVSTKPALIANLLATVRDAGYIEHDHQACDEMLAYEQLPDGTYGARRGCHDDVLMTRAIALYLHQERTGARRYRVNLEELEECGRGW